MGYPKSFNSWIDTKTILKTNYRKIALKLLRKKFIKTCFNKHDKISFNIYW